MKIAIPTNGRNDLDSTVSDHFGRCQTYTIIDENGNFLSTIENNSSHNGGTGLPPEILKKNGVDVLICSGIGPRALELCHKFYIQVFVNKGLTVKEIFNDWKSRNKPATMDDICEDHRK